MSSDQQSSTTSFSLPPSATQWTVLNGLPGHWRRLRTRLVVSATAADGIEVDGRLVDGLLVLPQSADGTPLRLKVRGACVELVDDGSWSVQVRTQRCA